VSAGTARSRASGVLIGAALLVALVGCTPADETPPTDETPAATAPTTPSPSATAGNGPDLVSPVFVVPTECTGLLSAALEQQFLNEGNALFSDSAGNGISPQEPIGQDGGDPFACLYGKDLVDLSTFELSAQPLDNEEHEGVLAELGSRPLTQEDDGQIVVFTQQGDEGTDPAIVHLVYPDGWITAYSTFGGADRLAEIRGWADTVVAQVSPQP